MSMYFSFNLHRANHTDRNQPDSISQIRLIPDSMTINGDLLAFEGEEKGNRFQMFYQMKSKEEFIFFRKNSEFLTLQADIKLEVADGQRNFNGFNYRNHLRNQGIYRIGRIKTIKKIQLSRLKHPVEYLSRWRRQAIVTCQQNYPDPMAHYMTGLLFGYLDKSFGQMTDIYSQLGIIHLFALSGMQVGFFLNLFRKLMIKLAIPQEYFAGVEFFFSLFYASMTGYSISVLRSLCQRNLSNMKVKRENNIAFTLFLLFIISPNFLATVGGVLSFSYSFIISYVTSESTKKRYQFVQPFVIAISAFPLLIFFFSAYHPLSMVLTAIFSVLFDSFILPLLTLLFFLTPILPLRIFNQLFEMMEVLVLWVGEHFHHPWVFGKPTPLQLFLFLIILALLYDLWNKRFVRYCLFVSLGILYFSIVQPLKNEVTIVDVGQGDSILLRDIYHKTILIDVGGIHQVQSKSGWKKRHSISNAQKTLIPYLKSRGIRQIDQLLLTHTDTDHVGDMEDVVKAIPTKEILVSQGSLTNHKFVERLNAMAIKTKVVKKGDELAIMGAKLKVLYPFVKGDGKNNDSIVLYGKLLNNRFLFTGDLEAEGEKEVIRHYPDLKVDILKAGHHGSKGASSDEFIDHILPKLALFSAGKNNTFKHPHDETLQRFSKRRIQTLQTNKNGAIRFEGLVKWKVDSVHP
ncbi:DNA internalization-related competence protein ComEC/Rec2 [Streptococcus hongkongensis]